MSRFIFDLKALGFMSAYHGKDSLRDTGSTLILYSGFFGCPSGVAWPYLCCHQAWVSLILLSVKTDVFASV